MAFEHHPLPGLRIPRVLGLLATTLLLCACGEAKQTADTNEARPDSEAPLLSIHDTMNWILEPAADVIWDSSGFIITAEGEEDLTPTTDEGWHAVIHAAAYLSEAGHLLSLPGRSPGADWDEYATGLTNAGQAALTAALARDSEALFAAGGRIYQVCRACHNQYWVKGEPD